MGKIDNERAMKLYRDGASDSELAEILGVSVSAVGQWRGKTGMKRNAAKRAEESLPQPAAPAAPSSEGALEAEKRPGEANQTVWEAEAMCAAEATEEEEENEEMKETEKKPELVERILAYVERKINQTEKEIHEVAEREGEALILACKKRALNEIKQEIQLLRVMEEHGL